MNPRTMTPGGESRTRHHGRGHIAALDGLRGVAVLGVMANHLITGDFSRASFPVFFFFRVAVSGVDLFFVLSGFLISGILLDSLEDDGYFRKFYARRTLRIFPLYYGVLLLALLLTRPLEIHWNGTLPSFLLYVQNLRLIPSVWEMPPQRYVQFTHLWTLAIEEQFYLVWPLALWLVRGSRRLLTVCSAGFVTSFALRWWMLTHGVETNVVRANTLCRMDELLLGAALVLLIRSRLGPALLRYSSMALCVFSITWLVYEWGSFRGWSLVSPAFSQTVDYSVVALFSAALVTFSLKPGSWAEAVLQRRTLRFFGKYSYGLYVLHVIALPAFLPLLETLRAHGVSKVASRAILGVLDFIAAVAAAYLSFHLYEKQFLKLKRYFDYA